MKGPATDILAAHDYQVVSRYLPATAPEIAAELGWPVKKVHGLLWWLGKKGWAKKTDRKIPNGLEGIRAKMTPLWVRI